MPSLPTISARRAAFSLRLLPLLVCLLIAMAHAARATPKDYFRITVVDDSTHRGVPLVELRTTNDIRFYTDSNGIAAIGDPDLLGHKIYFSISSPGYEYPKDGFGYRGVALQLTAGGNATIKVRRTNIAERLYRLTGSGIYRDSVLTGQPTPLAQPLMNGLVMGQDTVEVAPYRGKIYWFFGDTSQPAYPLGLFATSGAVSAPPDKGGLDPSRGVNLTYWVDKNGFSRAMIPIANSPGPVWVGGLFTMIDQGREHLFTNFAEVNHDMSTAVDGLAEFNDAKAVFEPVHTYPKGEVLHPEGHPFLADENGVRYLYFQPAAMGAFPLVRNLPTLDHMKDPASFESFTCLAPGGRFDGKETKLDRDANGRLIWGWKKNTAALGEDQANQLVAAGKMKPDELLTSLHDVDTDKVVLSHGGSVFWSPYRKRWIMITTQAFGSPSFLGEVWFAEADTPVGPWLYARKIATHDHYSFYNPTQHPFFDQDHGRLIYFEGTYTDTFSDVKDITPRYNYNQLMYRLALDDSRLSLPAPVYRVRSGYAMRPKIEQDHLANEILSIPFFAVPPQHPPAGLIPIYSVGDALQTERPTPSAAPLFYALPAVQGAGEKVPSEVVPLYEYRDAGAGDRRYSTTPMAGFAQSKEPLCRVWRNPSSVLTFDFGAQAVAAQP